MATEEKSSAFSFGVWIGDFFRCHLCISVVVSAGLIASSLFEIAEGSRYEYSPNGARLDRKTGTIAECSRKTGAAPGGKYARWYECQEVIVE